MKNIKKVELQQETLLTKSFWELSQKNKKSLDEGTPTLIPFSIPSLNKIIPGLIPNETIIVLGSSGAGKSRVCRKLALKDVKDYCDSKDIKLRVVINALEETREKVVATLIAKEIKEMYNIDVDYYSIANYKVDRGLTDEQMLMVDTARLEVERKYGNVLSIVSESNGYAYYKYLRQELHKIGKFYYIERDVNNHIISKKQIKVGERFNHYEYNEKSLFVQITDTIDKFQPYSETLNGKTNHLSTYDVIGKFVHYYTGMLLGPVCKVISFIVSQQSPSNEEIETNYAGKQILEKSKPNLSRIRTNRSIQETATLILGIWNPVKYTTNYGGYRNIGNLKEGKFMILSILKSREGVIDYPNNEIPLLAKFAIDELEELPKPDKLDKSYYK